MILAYEVRAFVMRFTVLTFHEFKGDCNGHEWRIKWLSGVSETEYLCLWDAIFYYRQILNLIKFFLFFAFLICPVKNGF